MTQNALNLETDKFSTISNSSAESNQNATALSVGSSEYLELVDVPKESKSNPQLDNEAPKDRDVNHEPKPGKSEEEGDLQLVSNPNDENDSHLLPQRFFSNHISH